MKWKQRKEETLPLWTKAVDRAATPGLLARQVSLALGQAEEARLSFTLPTRLPRGAERSCGGLSRRQGLWLWDRAGDTWVFSSVVIYNLLKSGFDKSTHLELG